MSGGWLPAAFNSGYAYRDQVPADCAANETVSGFYAARYPHSSREQWLQRLAVGQITRKGEPLSGDGPLLPGDRLEWRRPPWLEPAVPELPDPLFDDGDLVAFAKPSGLPVVPAGGFLVHTLLRQLEQRVAAGSFAGCAAVPRPVHRLGRFSSGLLLCARRRASRAWLSALLRESTALGSGPRSCRKIYRALLQQPVAGSSLWSLAPGESLELTTPIGRRPHARLGRVWAAAAHPDPSALPASSVLTLLEPRPQGWLVEVRIATGRPHQIRIHTAAAGAPLLGDPLYGPGGQLCDRALPGDGGYLLHAHRLQLPLTDGRLLMLEAPLPEGLGAVGAGGRCDGG